MKTPRKATLALAAFVSIVTLAAPGCNDRTSSGTEYTLTVDRHLEAYLTAPLAETHAAALAVVRDELKFKVTRVDVDGRQGIVEGLTVAGEDVSVHSFKSTEGVTRVLVGAGPLGDEPAMRDILNKIDARLKAGKNP